jgi:hypothetical protein
MWNAFGQYYSFPPNSNPESLIAEFAQIVTKCLLIMSPCGFPSSNSFPAIAGRGLIDCNWIRSSLIVD